MAGWIFQGNPELYDIDKYVTERNPIWWGVRPRSLEDRMRSGDHVFIWRSNGKRPGSGGIIAHGVLTGEAQEGTDPDADLWYEPLASEIQAVRRGIRLDDTRVKPEDGMLLRSDVGRVAGLEKTGPLEFSQGTTYELTETEVPLLLEVWCANHPRGARSQR